MKGRGTHSQFNPSLPLPQPRSHSQPGPFLPPPKPLKNPVLEPIETLSEKVSSMLVTLILLPFLFSIHDLLLPILLLNTVLLP